METSEINRMDLSRRSLREVENLDNFQSEKDNTIAAHLTVRPQSVLTSEACRNLQQVLKKECAFFVYF